MNSNFKINEAGSGCNCRWDSPATGRPGREHSGFGVVPQPVRADTQAGPTRLCPLDGYDVSWMRVSQRMKGGEHGRLDGKIAAVTGGGIGR